MLQCNTVQRILYFIDDIRIVYVFQNITISNKRYRVIVVKIPLADSLISTSDILNTTKRIQLKFELLVHLIL